MVRVNLGCGPVQRPGEIGVDRFPTSAVEVIADIKHLPFADNSCTYARLDHVLEHFPVREAVSVLMEIYRVMSKDSALIIGVPDFERICREFVCETNLINKTTITRWFYGSQAHEGEYHKSGWDRHMLTDILKSVGFEQIEIDIDNSRVEGLNLCATAVK